MSDTGAAGTRPTPIEDELLAAVSATRGHFRYESGHHGDLWLDLEALLVDARRVQGVVSSLLSVLTFGFVRFGYVIGSK